MKLDKQDMLWFMVDFAWAHLYLPYCDIQLLTISSLFFESSSPHPFFNIVVTPFLPSLMGSFILSQMHPHQIVRGQTMDTCLNSLVIR